MPLIDRDLFIDEYCKCCPHPCSKDSNAHCGAVARLFMIPTVDAVPVVHGRWMPVDHDGSWRVDKCSICNRRMHYVDYDQPYQYCPNCGAKMDEGVQGNV